MILSLGAALLSNAIKMGDTAKDGCNDTINITSSYSFNKDSLLLNNRKQTLLMKVLSNEEEEE